MIKMCIYIKFTKIKTLKIKKKLNQVCFTPLIPACMNQRQADLCEFQVSWCYRETLSQKKLKIKKKVSKRKNKTKK